jgi:hypothetical protein
MSSRKEIKYTDYITSGEMSLSLTGSGHWSFKSEGTDRLTRGDLFKVRNLFEEILSEQEYEGSTEDD